MGEYLHLARRDILAAAHDHVVRAPVEEEIAAAVEKTAIAGVEPAFGVEQAAEPAIFTRHLRSAHQMRPTRPRQSRARPRRAPRSRPSAAAADCEPPAADQRIAAARRLAMIVRPEQADGRAGFGEPIGVGEIDAGNRAIARSITGSGMRPPP